ncbi:hypothetical protein V9T20_12960 (plasmid) [Halobacterium salinarum]|jgi:hypothetical protein|uniref:hypothetical protein n=1 Tax=Halobacterium salinarum TaxID=2242 RepID=UPI0030D27C8D
MSDDAPDAEELLQKSKEQTRHTAEPSRTENDDVDRVAAIKEALLAIEDGDAPENINARDARLKALLVGLNDCGELEATAETLAAALDTDVETQEVSQSDVARLLLRVGLQEALPDILSDAKQARKQMAVEQADGF